MATEDSNTPEGQDGVKTFTQDDLNRAERKWKKHAQELEARLAAAPTSETIQELEAKIASLSEERELIGKTEMEKLQHQHARELEKLALRNEKYESELKARDQAVAEVNKTLQQERVSRAFSAALQKAEVFGPAVGDALTVLMAQLSDVETDGNGSVHASYGDDLINETPETIAQRFLEDRNYFALASGGGAGTKPPTGGVLRPESIAGMTEDELFAAAGPPPPARK